MLSSGGRKEVCFGGSGPLPRGKVGDRTTGEEASGQLWVSPLLHLHRKPQGHGPASSTSPCTARHNRVGKPNGPGSYIPGALCLQFICFERVMGLAAAPVAFG